MKLSEKIIKLRKEKGLSQEELGNAINVSRQAISKWESEQTKPDIDKLKEISKFFNVSFDYLLNDDCDEIKEIKTEEKIEINSSKNTKKNKNFILKILLVFIFIYLAFSLYKFILLFRYYKIADSFSEENYFMYCTWESDNEPMMDISTKKVGNKIIIESINPYDKESDLINEDGEVMPYDIEFIDQEKDICYRLVYNSELKKYEYWDRKKDALNEEELKNILNINNNLIKEQTLGVLPSNFKSILLLSLNPMCQVSLARNEIYLNNFNRTKVRTLLTNDCLVQNYVLETEFDGKIELNFSYDYVQDHFSDISIQEPLEKYSDMIVYIDELEESN